ncbi:MAG: carboxypeptidase regulatory-like domain-containing protein [Candidatus Ozemobacteraceae bacterium]
MKRKPRIGSSRAVAFGLMTCCLALFLVGCSGIGAGEVSHEAIASANSIQARISNAIRERLRETGKEAGSFPVVDIATISFPSGPVSDKSLGKFARRSTGKSTGSGMKASELFGTVLDAVSGLPVGGTALLAGKRVGKGDSDGSFRISGFKPGECVELLVTAEGYAGLAMKTRPVAADNRPLLIRLNPVFSSIRGRVLSSQTGKPLPGACIALGETRTLTDTNGIFLLKKIRPGYFSIEISAPRYLPVKQFVFVDEGKTSRTFKLDSDVKTCTE